MQSVDKALSPEVVSMRMARPPPAWRLFSTSSSFDKRSQKIQEIVNARPFVGALLTDVSNYFPSINVGHLFEQLLILGLPREPVEFTERWLDNWATANGLAGLPIGPEVSAIYGNADLLPVDNALTAAGVTYVRLTDDYFLEGTLGHGLSIELIDRALHELGLVRSEPKTHWFDDVDDLWDHMNDDVIEYYGGGYGGLTLSEARAAFDDTIAQPKIEINRYKWLMGFFREHRSTHPLSALKQNPHLVYLAPAAFGSYIRQLTRVDQLHLEPFLELLVPPTTQDNSAIKLQVSDAMRFGVWGYTESQALEASFTGERSSVLRASALMAWAQTPGLSEVERLAIATEGDDGRVRRGAILTFRTSSPTSRRARLILKELADTDSSFAATVNYSLN